MIWRLDEVNAWGQILSKTYGNGLETTKTYDEKGLPEIIVTGPNGNIHDLEYIYNSKSQMYQRADHRHCDITEIFGYPLNNSPTFIV